ncbi:MAG: hypothetical protein JXA10_19615, partial [Anaerolineae bacterium]|nr:hypothetical protein [Anaerolineae bacterium]
IRWHLMPSSPPDKTPRLALPRTLRLTRPFGRTILLALVILIVLAVGLETAARQSAIQARLPAPGVGSSHTVFEVKLHLYEAWLDQRAQPAQTGETGADTPDCLFLGSSVVHHGLNPVRLERAYQAQTGTALDCFNFGLNGGRETAGLILADVFTQDTPPDLIVFGVLPRMLNRQDPSPIDGLPWIDYRLGDFSITGWLADHSLAYGYGVMVGNQLFGEQFTWNQRRTAERDLARGDGHMPLRTAISRELAVARRDSIPGLDYALQPAGLATFDRLLEFRERTQIVVVIFPEHPITKAGYPERATDYADMLAQLRAHADAAGVPFWTADDLDFLLDDANWADFSHLNPAGTQLFSQWLGEQIGQAVAQGEINLESE